MDGGRTRFGGQSNVFKGSQLVTSVLERYPSQLRDRKSALQFCRQLFKEGTIQGVFDVDTFEDSVLLYRWNDRNELQIRPKPTPKMTSQSYIKSRGGYGISNADTRITKRDLYQHGSIKPIVEIPQTKQFYNLNHSHLPSDSLFVGNVHISDSSEPETNIHTRKSVSHHRSSPNYKRASTASSESSVDIASRAYPRQRDKNNYNPTQGFPVMTLPHDHDVIPEEVNEEHHVPIMERTGTSTEYDGSSSIPRSCATDVSNDNYIHVASSAHQRQWIDYQNSYSDNEKQLIEQMKRMKKEHSHILRTYEDRINKLMNKMHELRNIAQMLENSSTKSSPYGMLQSKQVPFSTTSTQDHGDRKVGMHYGSDGEHPPPLPPRPGRGSQVIPNKPLITPATKMKPLKWTRIILRDKSSDENSTIWHTVQEPTVDSEEIEKLFSNPEVSDTDGATLYDDLIIRRGRSRQQLVSIYDSERSKRIVICMKCLRATLTEVVSTVSSLDISQINHEGLAELFEFLSSSSHIEKTLHYVRRKGAGQLDHPEYLVFELSKVDHFTDRLEFIRFRYKTQWHLFEIEQQLRELNTACNELTNSISLKNLMETLLAVGNYLNGNTDFGQADGYALDVMNKLKETHEKDGKGTLLEFVLKTYCQIYESEVDIGCPTRFRLPEPSNMRHAAQVSFEGIQDALSNLLSDLRSVREKLLDQNARKDAIRPTDSFRVTAENFFSAALEVIGAQEKVLQDVRDLFLRTARYFQVDNSDVTPQQFFHIFAVFLHDCKYFWKLAHRRLAKERFELEFKFKGQLSAVDLHGYGSFRAGVTEGINSTLPTDPKTSTLTRDERASRPRNQKTPTVPPKPIHVDLRKSAYNTNHSRDHSPKPLTSTPPTSEKVHKPLPKTPISTPNHFSPAQVIHSPNYENQADIKRYQSRQQTQEASPVEQNTQYPGVREPAHLEHESGTKEDSKDRKNQQFSLRAWLKREREQVKREIESENNNENTSSHKKSNAPTRSFTRLKNSVIHKFSSGNSNKRDINAKDTKSDKDTRTQNHPQPVSERFESRVMGEQLSSPRTYHQPPYPQYPQYNPSQNRYLNGPDPEYNYNLSNPDVVISPIDDLEQEEIHCDKAGANISGKTIELRNKEPPQLVDNSYGSQLHTVKVVSENEESIRNMSQKVFHSSPHTSSNTPKIGSSALYSGIGTNNYENQYLLQIPNSKYQTGSQYEHSNNNNNSIGPSMSYQEPSVDRQRLFQQQGIPNNTSQPFYVETQANLRQDKSTEPSRNDNLNSAVPFVPTRKDNDQFLMPGNREPMHIQSIGSLTDKFNAMNNNEETDKPLDTVKEANETDKEGDRNMFSNNPSVHKSNTHSEISEISPPLPPRTYTTNEALKRTKPEYQSNPKSQDKVSHLSAYDRLQNLTESGSHVSSPQTNMGQFNTPQPFSRQIRSDSNIRPAGRTEQKLGGRFAGMSTSYLNSGPQPYPQSRGGDRARVEDKANNKTETEDKDEGYRAQLRRAANINPSAFTGYGSLKPGPHYTGRASLGPSYPSQTSTAVVKPTVLNNQEVSYMAF